ncbi:MAG: FadR family transcriptional regulator [Hyphomicrobiales bacterium]|nr:FadR family transcriptional regulator [Hyphomicrobiales bacterium]MBV9739493.1 FadR family transcriptional regulator [Hyphomicrobiales bacterium]
MEVSPGAILPSRSQRARARRQIDQLHAVLERQIDQGRIRPGERLATERELALQFGASRSVVRAALAELHRVGKIVRKVGHGTVVTTPSDELRGSINLPLLDTSPAELLEFRLAFEPGLAEAMTLNGSERDLRAVMECVEAGDKANGLEEWEHWDRRFHQRLVAATHNRLAIGVFDAIIAIRHERPWLKLKQGHTDAVRWAEYQSDHREIALAVLDRNAEAVAGAIRAHLAKVRTRMLGS